MLEDEAGKDEYGGRRESGVFDRRGLGNSQSLDRKLSDNVLFATRNIYHRLAEKAYKTDVSDLLNVPPIRENSSGEARKQVEQDQRTAIIEAQSRIASHQYKFVITESEEIAEAAAKNNIKSVLLTYDPKSETGLVEVTPGSYNLNVCHRNWIVDLGELLAYGKSETEQEATSAKHIILIVEDDPRNLRLCKQEIQDAGYEVKTAETVEEAYEALEEGNIDAVITDLRVPLKGYPHGTAGLHIFQQTQSLYPGMPVIIHTATKSGGILDSVRKMGVYDVVTKSSDSPQKLIKLVVKALSPKDLALFSDDATMEKIAEKVEGPGAVTKRFVAELDRGKTEQRKRELEHNSP